MQILITLPEYKHENGFKFEWENNFEITLDKNGKAIRLLANKEGLLSLSKQFLNLALKAFTFITMNSIAFLKALPSSWWKKHN